MNNASAKIFRCVIYASFILSVFFLNGQTSRAEEALSLSDLVKLGAKRSPQIKKQQADWMAAHEKTNQTKSALLPSIDLNSSATSRDFGSELTGSKRPEFLTYLEATQPLFMSGAITAGLNKYETLEKIEAIKLNGVKQKVLYDIMNAYYTSAQQFLLRDAAETNSDVLKKYIATINRYQKIGRARKTDELQAELNWLTSQSALQDIESNLYKANEDLRSLLSLEDVPKIKIENRVAQLPTVKISEDQALKSTFNQNPDIQVATLNEELVNYNKKIELSSDLPSLKLVGQYGYRSNDSSQWTETPFNYSSIAIVLKVPIFSGLSSFGKRREFEQQKISSTRTLEVLKLNIESQLKSTLKQMNLDQARFKMANETYEKAKYALTLASREYEKGLISSSDLINIQKSKYEADRFYIQTQFDFQKSFLTYKWLTGESLE